MAWLAAGWPSKLPVPNGVAIELRSNRDKHILRNFAGLGVAQLTS
jgi:hypothetical protein